MYSFDKRIDDHHRNLILEAQKICNELEVPISSDCYFTIAQGETYYGICYKDKKYGFKIAIHIGLIDDDDYVNTAIHEMLHTIDNSCYTSHRGNWKKWADIVSSNTKYKMTVTDNKKLNSSKVKKRNSSFKISKELICPMCENKEVWRFQYESELKLGFISGFCQKCHKPYYVELPESILKEKSVNERHEYFKSLNLNNISYDDLKSLLPYLSNEDAIEVISAYVQNNKFPDTHYSELKELLFAYGRADHKILAKLCELYCDSKLDNILTNENAIFEFENIFSLTEYYPKVTEHTMLFKKKK